VWETSKEGFVSRVSHNRIEGYKMAMGQTLQFSGAGIDKYDEVQEALGWQDKKGAPEGLLAHAAGATENGFCVVEW
jgi:hypothetical protein